MWAGVRCSISEAVGLFLFWSR